MEMLVFFFISLFAGILAAYFVEHHNRRQPGQYDYGQKEDMKSMVNRLQKISRQF